MATGATGAARTAHTPALARARCPSTSGCARRAGPREATASRLDASGAEPDAARRGQEGRPSSARLAGAATSAGGRRGRRAGARPTTWSTTRLTTPTRRRPRGSASDSRTGSSRAACAATATTIRARRRCSATATAHRALAATRAAPALAPDEGDRWLCAVRAERRGLAGARLKARGLPRAFARARWGNSHAELRRESPRSVRAHLETRFGHALDKHGALWREVSGYAQEYLRFTTARSRSRAARWSSCERTRARSSRSEPPRDARALGALRMQERPARRDKPIGECEGAKRRRRAPGGMPGATRRARVRALAHPRRAGY